MEDIVTFASASPKHRGVCNRKITDRINQIHRNSTYYNELTERLVTGDDVKLLKYIKTDNILLDDEDVIESLFIEEICCEKNCHKILSWFMDNYGLEINHESKMYFFSAVCCGYKEIVKVYIDHGLDIRWDKHYINFQITLFCDDHKNIADKHMFAVDDPYQLKDQIEGWNFDDLSVTAHIFGHDDLADYLKGVLSGRSNLTNS